MSSRREPLLWLQCLAIGTIPLELLLLRLVLAGSDLGPLPGLERILAWAIGALAPAVWLWRHQPDWGSLLLVRRPLQGRDRIQQQFSRDLQTLPVKLIAAAGVLPLLIMLWWIDGSALLVADLTPFRYGSRLGSLLLATPLLALILWQWQQLVQALWLLIQPADTKMGDSAATGMDACLQAEGLSLGLSVLQLSPLDWETEPKQDFQTESIAAEVTRPKLAVEPEPERSHPDSLSAGDSPTPNSEASETNADQTSSAFPGTVEPEQSSEKNNSTNLNPQVGGNDSVPSAEPETHDEETETSGSEQSTPEQPPEPPPGSA